MDQPEAIVDELAKISAFLQRQSQAVLSEFGLSPQQFDVLRAIREKGPAMQRDLSLEYLVEKSGMSKSVAKLVSLGLVVREPSPEDGRAWFIQATERGAAVADICQEQLIKSHCDWLEARGQEDQQEGPENSEGPDRRHPRPGLTPLLARCLPPRTMVGGRLDAERHSGPAAPPASPHRISPRTGRPRDAENTTGQRMKTITWNDFEQVELRAGTITRVEDFPEARKPAYKVWADFGPDIGELKTSAQVTTVYEPDELVGKQIMGVVNFPVKQIGPMRSEFLLTGFYREDGAVILAVPEREVHNGARLG